MSNKIHIKKGKDIEGMRESCRLAHLVLDEVVSHVRPGISTAFINHIAGEIMTKHGVKSAFLGHHGFPGNLCISVNEEVIHGVGTPALLEIGDIVSLDVGTRLNGWIGDNCRTVPVGGCTPAALQLIDVTRLALQEGIKAAKPGNHVSDIGKAVQAVVESHGHSVVRDFVGHGVGRELHELPQIPNWDAPREAWEKDYIIRPGMTLAIEPMVIAGSDPTVVSRGNFTVVSKVGSWAAHEEETVLITEAGAEILTC